MNLVFPARFLVGVRRLGWLAVAALLAALAGCATGEYTYVKTTAYGERLNFPLEKGQPQWASKGGITIWAAALLPSAEREKQEVFFAFGFTDESGVAPTKVRIEDVSDEKPLVVHEDNEPKLDETNRWRSTPRMLKAGAPEIAWTSYVGDTFRVYRFVITKADGREVVLHQAMSVPAWMKASMRKTLGIE
jgi:hypothetical protein